MLAQIQPRHRKLSALLSVFIEPVVVKFSTLRNTKYIPIQLGQFVVRKQYQQLLFPELLDLFYA